MKIAVTGHRGRLGSELVKQGCFPLLYDTKVVPLHLNSEVDITNESQLKLAIEYTNPDVIINCAAFTDVDACEDNGDGWDKAKSVNFWGVEYLKRTFKGRIIHISTDYVFDGRSGAYDEKSEYSVPVNSYGMTKMVGEIAFLNPYRHGDVLIRTTGLYGRNGHHDLAQLVISKLSKGEALPISKELMGNQTYIPHFAEALINIANRPAEFYNIQILNVASQEIVSRYEFALMVASMFKLDKKLLIPVKNKQIDGWIAERPTKAGLKVGLAKKMKVPIYKILDGLKALKNDLSDNPIL